MARFTIIESSFFNGLNRLAKGEDITPQLRQLQDLGFNFQRTFTAFHLPLVGDCEPEELYPYYHDYFDLCAQYGLYVEPVAIAGYTWPNDAAMVAHWEKVKELSAPHTNVLPEVFNEYGHPLNPKPNPLLFTQPATGLASHGSGVQDALPVQPFWNVVSYRPGGGPEWMRKVAHNGMEDVAEKYDKPTWNNEIIRCPDHDTNPIHFYDAAAGAALLCAGTCFHSNEGKLAVPLTGQTLICAQAFVAGARSVPFEYQAGAYRRIVDPQYLRVYQRVLPDGRAWTVPIRY